MKQDNLSSRVSAPKIKKLTQPWVPLVSRVAVILVNGSTLGCAIVSHPAVRDLSVLWQYSLEKGLWHVWRAFHSISGGGVSQEMGLLPSLVPRPSSQRATSFPVLHTFCGRTLQKYPCWAAGHWRQMELAMLYSCPFTMKLQGWQREPDAPCGRMSV